MYYVYLIKNIETKMSYIGCRKSKNESSIYDLSRYRTSSSDKDFKSRLTTNPEDFTYEILKEFDNQVDAMSYEKSLLVSNDVINNKMFYNKRAVSSIVDYSKIKKTSQEYKGSKGKRCEASKKRMSESAKARGINNHEFCYGDKRGDKNPFFGKKHIAETKDKMSEYAKNRTEEHKKNLIEGIKKRPPRTKESFDAQKKKCREQTPIMCPHCGLIGKYPGIKRWHFDNCKKFRGITA